MRELMNEEDLTGHSCAEHLAFTAQADVPHDVRNKSSATSGVTNTRTSATRSATDTKMSATSEFANTSGSDDITNKTGITSVKFLFNGKVIYTDSFRTHTTLREVKTKLTDVFHEDVELKKQGIVLTDDVTLAELGAVALGTIELELTSEAGVDLSRVYRPSAIPTVDVIMVRVLEGKRQIKECVVEIEKSERIKPWLGGYRNKHTKTIYHHAATQTEFIRKNQVPSSSQCVQTPTFPLKQSETNTMIDRRTQTRSRCFPDINDIIRKVSDKPYETYDEWLSKNNVVNHVIKIQTWYRNIKNRKRKEEILDQFSQYTEQHFHDKEELRKKLDTDIEDENTQETSKDLIKETPSNRQDFDVLYMMIGKWWSTEIQRIREIGDELVRKNEYMRLLKKEIYYLSKLDRCRAESREKAMQKQLLSLLNKASKPKKMITSNNKEVTIATLETQRASVLRNIYAKVIRRDVSVGERTLILQELRDTLAQCRGVDSILALVEKEIAQMKVSVPEKNLEMTRMRIELLFSKLIKFPEYSKSSKGDIRMSSRAKRLTTPEQRYFTCSRCNRTLPASEYPSGAQKSIHKICNSCEWVENVGSKRIDLKPYKRMLKNIQKRELDRNATCSLCFGMQPSGMYYLVNVIWDGHSAISERTDISQLQCIRWDRTQDWAPWNCIVLTASEAELHENISDVKELYSAAFVNKVTLRHIAARIQFLSLPEQEDRVEFTGAFSELTTDANVLLDKSYVTNFMALETRIQ